MYQGRKQAHPPEQQTETASFINQQNILPPLLTPSKMTPRKSTCGSLTFFSSVVRQTLVTLTHTTQAQTKFTLFRIMK